MDLNYSAGDEAFRTDVRAFLEANLPADLQQKVRQHKRLSKDDYVRWHKIVARQGWAAPAWPVEFGGPGWNAVQRHIWEEECARAGTPAILPFGVNMVAPVIMAFGNEEQKAHYLPRILNCDDWWCQGYSEPGSGSDLASLKTTAERQGDHYIVNGQKTWTTLGQHANMIFCLVRTDREAKQQQGISFLLIDMNTPGIDVRPILTLDGEHEVNEVFFTDVRVPAENLVGEENHGWTCAKYLLTYERTNIAGVGYSVAGLERLKRIAARQARNGKPLLDDPGFAARLALVEIDLENMKTTNLRMIAAVAGGGVPGAESSMLKIRGTEIRQEILALTRRAMGVYARPFTQKMLDTGYDGPQFGPDFAAAASAQYFNNRKLSIFGGSNEIQRNIISKMILGL
jgi:alkylation response protein AidB-like acyl-CoA dehydrogenase